MVLKIWCWKYGDSEILIFQLEFDYHFITDFIENCFSVFQFLSIRWYQIFYLVWLWKPLFLHSCKKKRMLLILWVARKYFAVVFILTCLICPGYYYLQRFLLRRLKTCSLVTFINSLKFKLFCSSTSQKVHVSLQCNRTMSYCWTMCIFV